MNIKAITGPTIALAVAIAASSFAGCSGAQGGGMLPMASSTRSQAQNRVSSPNERRTSAYQMIEPLTATISRTKMLVTAKAGARQRSCAVDSTSATPLTLSETSSFTVSPIDVGGFDCNGERAAGTQTNYYVVMVTNPTSSSIDDSAIPIAGPAIQNGQSLTFPLSVDPLLIPANTPSYFYIAAYTQDV